MKKLGLMLVVTALSSALTAGEIDLSGTWTLTRADDAAVSCPPLRRKRLLNLRKPIRNRSNRLPCRNPQNLLLCRRLRPHLLPRLP